MTHSHHMDVEDLEVYKNLCPLPIECIRMLNGLEKTWERKVPEPERCWQFAEETAVYGVIDESFPQDCLPPDT